MPKAIDFHIHPPHEPGRPPSIYEEQMQRYFGSELRPGSVEEMVAKYEELDIFGVLLAVDHESACGEPRMRNDYLADIVRRHPRRFAGFGIVNPWQGKLAIKEVERCKALGLSGIKFLPMTQEFFPNEQRFYPIYEKVAELGLLVLFHTGTTAIGAGLPGGGGIHLKYSNPMYIDDVAADFPELTIIMAHPAFPWQDEQLAILIHKPNVYMDLSGWSPKYFASNLIQYANTLLQDKMLFGSDYPGLSPERWLRDFQEAPFRAEVRPKILLENAKRLLALGF